MLFRNAQLLSLIIVTLYNYFIPVEKAILRSGCWAAMGMTDEAIIVLREESYKIPGTAAAREYQSVQKSRAAYGMIILSTLLFLLWRVITTVLLIYCWCCWYTVGAIDILLVLLIYCPLYLLRMMRFNN